MKIGLIGCYAQSYRDPFATHLCLASLENHFQSEGHTTQVLLASIADNPDALEAFDHIVMVGNPFDEPRGPWSQWLVSLRPELADKICLVGLKGFDADALLDEQRKVLERIGKKSPIGICDKAGRDQLAKVVGAKNAVLTALPAFWVYAKALRLKRKTRLFLPAANDPSFRRKAAAWAQLTRRFYRRWSALNPAVFGGVHSDCLDLAAPANEFAFFQPSAPALLVTALVSADAVVAGHTAELLVAVQNNVPGILLSNDPIEKAMAEALGIPFLETHTNSQSAELVHRAEELLNRYPWETVMQKRTAMMEKTSELLVEMGLTKKSHTPKKRTTAPVGDRHWATLASENNLASVLGFVENILSIYDGRSHFHILCSSRSVEAALETALRPGSWTPYSLRSLWTEGEWQSCMRYDSTRALSMSKPRFLLRALDDCKCELFYADAETVFFRDPQELVSPAEVPACLVARYCDSSADTAANGLFSASLLSVQPSAVSFLNWWASFSLEPRAAGMTPENYREGKILDSAPLLFPTIRVVREPGVLAESGNLESTSIDRPAWPGDVLRGFDGRKVVAFRSSGVDALHASEIKSGWDQLACIFIGLKKSFESGRLRETVWRQQRLHWPRLDSYLCAKEWIENHVPMLAHRPRLAEVRFFTFGLGRTLVTLVSRLGLTAPPLGNARFRNAGTVVVGGTAGLWKTWQQTLLRGLFHPTKDTPRHTQVA